ncbi:unnamed protein product [Clonostachys rosea f. rosea IK726]|uniref:Uncharacterized protein n=1 Tax=Clonostachys rosea f. rosea IK726 TaxID=1349383 RepID=A0ACA9T716_BIOOC|nr:unnamed protein product [Clonostachys rosea f. rosea IK726]
MLAELSYCCCFSEEAGSGHFVTSNEGSFTYSERSMVSDAFAFLWTLVDTEAPVEEVPVGGIFCLLDCRPEGPGSELGLVWLLAWSGGGGFFRFLVDDGVVLELFEVSVEMVPSVVVEGTGAPEGRATWLAAWRADDLVILGGMSNEVSRPRTDTADEAKQRLLKKMRQ